jgi:recombination protein RecR
MEKLKALIRLEESLAKLPSVGRRSAERMAYAMLNMEDDDLTEFSDAIKSLKQSIHVCPICGFLTEGEKCVICDDSERDQDTLMIVSFPKDVIAFENAEYYRGLYHV